MSGTSVSPKLTCATALPLSAPARATGRQNHRFVSIAEGRFRGFASVSACHSSGRPQKARCKDALASAARARRHRPHARCGVAGAGGEHALVRRPGQRARRRRVTHQRAHQRALFRVPDLRRLASANDAASAPRLAAHLDRVVDAGGGEQSPRGRQLRRSGGGGAAAGRRGAGAHHAWRMRPAKREERLLRGGLEDGDGAVASRKLCADARRVSR